MAIYDRDYMRDEPPTLGERLRRVSAFQWFFWANIVVFFLQWVTVTSTQESFMPGGAVSIQALSQGQVWTPFTFMFVHGSAGHILMNMLMLWFIGRTVQDLFGSRHFSLIYILSGLVGAALQIVLCTVIARLPDASLMGASASVMGLLMALAVAMPEQEITLWPLPFRFRLWSVAKFLLIFNGALGCLEMMRVPLGFLSSGGASTAYLAHAGGALAGWYYARIMGYGGLPVNLPSLGSSFKAKRKPALAGPRRRMPAVELDEEAIRRENPRQDPVVDLMRHEVDPILDKINDFGFNSLTDEERRTLERASRQMTKKEKT